MSEKDLGAPMLEGSQSDSRRMGADRSAERRLLVLSAVANLASAALGLTFAVLTRSQAILLDGLFDVTYFIAAVFTIKVAALVNREDDERFPLGFVFFEPLVNGLKGVLVLGVCLMAFADAMSALLSGGREIAAGFAMLYGAIAAVLCGAMAMLMRRRNRRIGSPLIRVDAENWTVNGMISACVVLAFGSIIVLSRTPWSWFTPFVDPLIVVTVIAFSISVPVRMAWQALMELLNRTPSQAINTQVREAIERALAGFPVRELFVRVVQPGRSRLVLAHVVFPPDLAIARGLSELDAVRERALRQLQDMHPTTVLDMVFTGHRLWGAPTGPVQQVPVGADASQGGESHRETSPQS